MSADRPAVGDVVPALTRTVELPDMVAYAGATWDWHRIHYDADFVAAKQLPGPIVDGQVFGAYLVAMLQDAFGPRCFVRELDFSFRNLMHAGETVRCAGEVAAVDEDTESGAVTVTVTMTATILGLDGAPDRFAVKPATAVVLLGSADGPAT